MKRCLLAVLLGFVACGLAGLRVLKAQPPWAPPAPAGGLRTRLVADKTTYTIGEPVPVRLELINETGEELGYFSPQEILSEGGLIVGRDGEPVRYIAGSFQTAAGPDRIASSQTKTIATLNLAKYWDLRQPGHYTVQFPASSTRWPFMDEMRNADPDQRLWESIPESDRRLDALPASNVLELAVELPPDGKIPPLDVSRDVRVALAAARMNPQDCRGMAVNYRPHELLADGEALAGALSVMWPDGPSPVYENREVALLFRLPTCRLTDEFTVDRAEIDGSTIRVDLRRQQGPDQGPGATPYAEVGLARLLGPGEYTCQVHLTSQGPDPQTRPEEWNRELRFTVLPARRAGWPGE